VRTEALLDTFSPFSNCYRVGRLNIEAVEHYGVPKGPLLARLKAGHDVVLPDGRVVHSAAVVSPPQPGRMLLHFGDWQDVMHAVKMETSTGRKMDYCAFNSEDANQVGTSHFFRLIDV
jgi:ribonuclease Z